jgi:CTP synthase (UTP-ammonia lyase)
MTQELAIGIIGDFDPAKPSHVATNDALKHAAARLDLNLALNWLPTPSLLPPEARLRLDRYDAVWASPGSPYQSDEGAILGIRQARLYGLPFLGT